MKLELSPQQDDIVTKTSGNIVVSASAGTGKTRTLAEKIIHDLSKNITHKVIAAITFTIRAAQEIRDRLAFDVSECFIGTNNSFAIEEIIKPFMKDVYGEEFDIDIDTDYANECKLETFEEGVQAIKDSHTIYSYKNNKKNFVFELAHTIVKNSTACRLYLQAKYFGIYVDEYQDCDVDMHSFFMYLCDNLNIITFIVGDDKQSIYRWRGANPDSFKSVFTKTNFIHKELTQNHRSHRQIQDYSNMLFAETNNLVSNPENSGNILWVLSTDADWAATVIPLLQADKTSALLRSQKDYSPKTKKYGASDGADSLTTNGLTHIFIPPTPIDDITTNSAWLYMSIASYIMLDSYSAYNFISDIPTESDKVVVGKIQQLLKKAKDSQITKSEFKLNVTAIASYLGYEVAVPHLEKLFETISDTKYAVALNPEKPLHCTLTMHSSKGLEFQQVILFIEDYAFYGNVNADHINNHYVACTRAEEKLIIVDTQSSDANAARKKICELIRAGNIEPKDLITIVKSDAQKA